MVRGVVRAVGVVGVGAGTMVWWGGQLRESSSYAHLHTHTQSSHTPCTNPAQQRSTQRTFMLLNTRMALPLTTTESAVWVTVPLKRPCTVSYLNM